ncbi:MAG: tetratricopeptide repeat protein [Paracoccaceae bacterium]
MATDICNSNVSLNTTEAVEDWNSMVLSFLAHGADTPIHLGAVLDREPDFAMGHAARGLFSLMLGRKEMVVTARQALQTARSAALVTGRTQRERGWISALEIWLAGRPSGAINEMEKILAQNPADTLSMKVSHAIRFILGDGPGMLRSVQTVLPAHGEDHPCRGYALGCHAFALEEAGEYVAAERQGLKGLSFASNDAWGLHAVAHVFDMTARATEGIKLIEDHQNAWLHCNNFRYHVWWHKALLHLDLGETERVLELYDQKIRHDKTDDYRDIANATSLLTRLELDGVPVGDRWAELADLAQNRTDDGCLVFADLHYMLALTGDKRETGSQSLLTRFSQDAAKPGEMNNITADPGVAAAIGLNAFAEGRYSEAFHNLAAARPNLQTIGGSHAQRDVFERITIDAGLRAGHYEQTEAILTHRLVHRGGAEDSFAVSRFTALDTARLDASRIPAQ